MLLQYYNILPSDGVMKFLMMQPSHASKNKFKVTVKICHLPSSLLCRESYIGTLCPGLASSVVGLRLRQLIPTQISWLLMRE